jgi:hypothetical protein
MTPLPRAKNAELVTFRVSQNDPGLGALSHINVCGAKSNEPLDLSFLVVRPEVEVQPVFARLGLGYPSEQQPRKAVFARSYLELVRLVVDHNPAERFLPPAAKQHRIFCVNVYLLPFEPHW